MRAGKMVLVACITSKRLNRRVSLKLRMIYLSHRDLEHLPHVLSGILLHVSSAHHPSAYSTWHMLSSRTFQFQEHIMLCVAASRRIFKANLLLYEAEGCFADAPVSTLASLSVVPPEMCRATSCRFHLGHSPSRGFGLNTWEALEGKPPFVSQSR